MSQIIESGIATRSVSFKRPCIDSGKQIERTRIHNLNHGCLRTARNATESMQVVDFTGLVSLSSSCSKSVGFTKLHPLCENQTYCNLIFADLLQVVETTCIKLVNKKS